MIIQGFNESYVKLLCDDKAQEMFIKDNYTFIMKGWEFTPKGRAGLWDGKLSYYNMYNKNFHKGLLFDLLRFCEQNNIPVSFQNLEIPKEKITLEQLREFTKKLNIHAGGNPIELHDYQEKAIIESINRERILIKSGTSSGKSLIIYVIMVYYYVHNQNQLIMVPSTSLVEQMYKDFIDYSSHCTEINIGQICTKLYTGQKPNPNASVLITTWQSLQRKDKEFFQQFNVLYGDEAHSCKATVLNDIILNKSEHIKYRIGTTGTTSNDVVDEKQKNFNEKALVNLFSDIFVAVTTKELADRGISAKAHIKCIQLQYSNELRYLHKKQNWLLNYQKEIKWLCQNKERREFIASLPQYFKGNTLILCNFRKEFGIPVYELLKAKYPTHHVFYLDGQNSVTEREHVRQFIENNENVILLASYGIYQQGINVKNLFNIVLAVPYKSATRILQSIGRGLRKKQGKDTVNIVDISDNLQMPKERANITKLQADVRYKTYEQEQFECKFVKINIK